jgi:hypothetical protein
MNIRQAGPDQFLIDLTREQLLLFSNALNEVCNGIEAWEFSTRLGSQRDLALAMLSEISRALT